MSVSLATMVARLKALVPAKDSIPIDGDYAQHVKDAVLQISHDAPLRKIGTLSVVSGTANYTLPTDFSFLIELPELTATQDVIVNASGIIPLSADYDEEVTIAGSTLTITPTPTYTLDRLYRYAAIHLISGTVGAETYTTLTDNLARIALLYAQHIALMQQSSVMAGNAWKYSIGDESVDKTQQASGYRTAADNALKEYSKAVAALKGYGA